MLARGVFRLLETAMVLCLLALVLMVFTNALLRKLTDFDLVLFGGGISIAEEMSRFVFVWLTFIGAVVVAREQAHIGIAALVARFGRRGRLAFLVASEVLTLVCCVVFFWGTWQLAPLHVTNQAPITGLPMIWVYGIGFFASAGLALLSLGRLFRALSGRMTDRELRHFAGEYDTGDDMKPASGRL
ncbi:MAG: TRAP transporter small permease [Elioraea sp.]|nr:TRAP transporter small permease [Elioraea sp.]MDW8444371.1 TRAP transporter small permease [Acetobacteraceae bacterium]